MTTTVKWTVSLQKSETSQRTLSVQPLWCD
jgi:hypothetical protein